MRPCSPLACCRIAARRRALGCPRCAAACGAAPADQLHERQALPHRQPRDHRARQRFKQQRERHRAKPAGGHLFKAAPVGKDRRRGAGSLPGASPHRLCRSTGHASAMAYGARRRDRPDSGDAERRLCRAGTGFKRPWPACQTHPPPVQLHPAADGDEVQRRIAGLLHQAGDEGAAHAPAPAAGRGRCVCTCVFGGMGGMWGGSGNGRGVGVGMGGGGGGGPHERARNLLGAPWQAVGLVMHPAAGLGQPRVLAAHNRQAAASGGRATRAAARRAQCLPVTQQGSHAGGAPLPPRRQLPGPASAWPHAALTAQPPPPPGKPAPGPLLLPEA